MSGRGDPGVASQTLEDWRAPAAMIGLVRNLLFKNRGLVLRDSDRQGHGQPSVCPWLSALWGASAVSCWGENKTSPRKGKADQSFPPATRWPRDISGRIGVEKTVFGPVSWKLGDGEVSVSVLFDNGWGWRGWRWGQGGAKGKQQSNNFYIWFEVSEY